MGRRKKNEKIECKIIYPKNFDKKEFDKKYCEAIINLGLQIIENMKNKEIWARDFPLLFL